MFVAYLLQKCWTNLVIFCKLRIGNGKVSSEEMDLTVLRKEGNIVKT